MKKTILLNSVVLLVIAILGSAPTVEGRTIYVDNDGPADFNNIQAAIDDANNGDTVIVADGTYTGDGNQDITFLRKAITVRSENGPENCIIDCNGYHRGVTLSCWADGNAALDGFTIINAYKAAGGGIHCSGSNVVIENCWIINNSAGFSRSGYGGGIYCFGSGGNPIIRNCRISGNTAMGGGGIDGYATIIDCIISGNSARGYGGGVCGAYKIINSTISGNTAWKGGGIIGTYDIINSTICGNTADEGGGVYSGGVITNCTFVGNSAAKGSALAHYDYGEKPEISNCIFWDGGSEIYCEDDSCTVTYCNVQGGWPGEGNINVDPCFAKIGYWDPNGTLQDPNDDFWVDGDYHLKSRAGRWDANEGRWTKDDVTSPCIDAGDPASPIGYEPFPNGGIINMGVYGGTTKASKSYIGEPICETIVAGDINGDCKVDFLDFALLALHWLERPNQPPVVYIIAPEDGATLHSGVAFEIEADAYDTDGSVVKVEFFVDGSWWGKDNDGSDGWKMATSFYYERTYILKAKATDNNRAISTSLPVTVTVVEQ